MDRNIKIQSHISADCAGFCHIVQPCQQKTVIKTWTWWKGSHTKALKAVIWAYLWSQWYSESKSKRNRSSQISGWMKKCFISVFPFSLGNLNRWTLAWIYIFQSQYYKSYKGNVHGNENMTGMYFLVEGYSKNRNWTVQLMEIL